MEAQGALDVAVGLGGIGVGVTGGAMVAVGDADACAPTPDAQPAQSSAMSATPIASAIPHCRATGCDAARAIFATLRIEPLSFIASFLTRLSAALGRETPYLLIHFAYLRWTTALDRAFLTLYTGVQRPRRQAR